MRKAIVFLTLLVVVVIGSYFYWFYFNKFGEGYSDGLLQKLTRKGNVFKTYEGELLMSGFGQRNGNLQSQYFYFSVVDPKIASDLGQNTGKQIRVHYIQYRKSLPWRGEAYKNRNDESGQYIVDKIEFINNSTDTPDAELSQDMIPY